MGTFCKKPLTLLLTVLFGSAIWAQSTVEKTLDESRKIDHNGRVNIENKYGDIRIIGWDQNEVTIHTKITVSHKRESDARELLSRIDSQLKSGANYLEVVSVIANKNSGWFADLFNKVNPLDFDRSHVRIDYEVHTPKKSSLNITNRFGDVFIEDWNGELNTLIEHGDLWLGDDLGKADLVLKFGKLKAQSIDFADIAIKNGNIEMNDSESMKLNSDGSKVLLGNITSLELYSSKDEIRLAQVENLYGSMDFSELTSSEILKHVDMKLNISDFNIDKVSQPNAEINLYQESSDIRIHINGFAHKFMAEVEQGLVRLPKSFSEVDSKIIDKSKKLRAIEGIYGSNGQGHIEINGKKGLITLME